MSEEELLADHSDLELEDIRQALSYAVEVLQEHGDPLRIA